MSVSYDRIGPVAVLTLDRPQRRNAVDAATADALRRAYARWIDDDAPVAVLTGAGGHFCAGADLKAMDLADRDDGFLGPTRETPPRPIIAAIEGACVAGGLELALWCDVRVAAQNAFFGCYERRWGVPLGDGGTQRLPRIVGLGRALDMILTGRRVDAAEALAMGLINRITETGAARDEAVALATRLAAYPQETLTSDRAAVYAGLGRPLVEGLAIERRHALEVLDVAREGATRFAGGEGRHGTGVG